MLEAKHSSTVSISPGNDREKIAPDQFQGIIRNYKDREN